MSGIQVKVRTGLGAMLAAAGAVTWQATGAISASVSPPPLFDLIYPDAPDCAAALATYAVGGDDPKQPVSALMLQVRTRSNLTTTASGDDLDDAISQQLMGHFPLTLSTGIVISTIIRMSSSPIGRDPAGRIERTTNYRLTVHDPGSYRA